MSLTSAVNVLKEIKLKRHRVRVLNCSSKILKKCSFSGLFRQLNVNDFFYSHVLEWLCTDFLCWWISHVFWDVVEISFDCDGLDSVADIARELACEWIFELDDWVVVKLAIFRLVVLLMIININEARMINF